MKKTLFMLLCAALLLTTSCAKTEGESESSDQGTNESLESASESSEDVPEETSGEETDATETEWSVDRVPGKRGEEAGFDYISDYFVLTDDGSIVAEQASRYASRSVLGAAFNDYSTLGEYYVADVHVDFNNMNSSAGILFGAAKTEGFDGFTGYAFMMWGGKVYLYEIKATEQAGVKRSQLSVRTVEKPDSEEGAWLRVERAGNVYRMYYLDDMEGVEPWPEFEFTLKNTSGDCVGCIDDGHGATFGNLSVTAYTPEETSDDIPTYLNPVLTDDENADPYVLKYDGKYYLYATNTSIGYDVYESTDLVNWENKGKCCGALWGLTAYNNYFAPEVIEYKGKFYMIATAQEHLGFAVADSPLGPFVEAENWLFEKTIDGHVFVDDDGTPYLYYVSWRSGHEYGIYGCQLSEDLMSVVPDTEKMLLKATSSWEVDPCKVVEGPFMLKHNGLYYLMYSGSDYGSKKYAVGYAISESPLGDFDRYEANPILSYTHELIGPGHHSVTTSPDDSEMIIVYHVHNNLVNVWPRYTCIDRIRFAPTESGVDRMEVWGPTHVPQEYPH